MMGCFSTSQTDGTEESFRMSLRSLLATKETPIPAPCMAKKIIERKLGFGTRKTLQARTNLLDTACHSLAKAKQRTLVSLPPSYYIKSEILLFPLPLPPGYKPTNNSKPSIKSISAPSRKLLTANSRSASDRVQKANGNSANATSSANTSKKVDDFCADCSLISSNASCISPGHSSSNSTTTCHLCSCEALTPTSPTSSSSVFSAATSYSLSQSSSFNSTSTTYSDLNCNALLHALENEDSSFFTGALQSAGSPLKEFSPLEIARAFESSGHVYKLTDGAMGPFYKVVLPEEKCCVAITRVATKLSRKKWRAQVQALARLAHSNLSKVIGFSYERAKYVNGLEGMPNDNLGFIVYEDIGDESLKDFLQDVERGIDWSIRLKLAIGIAEGLSFLLENMPGHVDYGDLTVSNLRVDSSLSVKLFDFVLTSTNISNLKEKKLCNVVQSLGNVLFQVFDFVSYSQNGGAQESWPYKGACPQNDARVVADIATSCLLLDASSRPSVRQVARVLHSIEPTQYVAKHSIKRSKSFTYRRKKSLSFG